MGELCQSGVYPNKTCRADRRGLPPPQCSALVFGSGAASVRLILMLPQRASIVPAWRAMLTDTVRLTTSLLNAPDDDAIRRLPGHAEAVVADAVDLAGAMVVAGDRLARLVPGYTLAAAWWRRAEDAALRELKKRLEVAGATGELDSTPGRPGQLPPTDPRTRLLDELLQACLRADTGRSQQVLHLRILRSLVPDEARILAALSDGTPYPLMHIQTRGPGPTRTLLANACTVGRVAGVHLHSAVPVYVTHMRALGLVEEGPHDGLLSDQYLLLESESYARRAASEAQDGLLGIRRVRRTLRISKLGGELWAACRPDERQPSGTDTPEPYRSAYARPLPERSPGL